MTTTLLLLLTNAIGGSSYPAATIVLRAFPERDAAFLRLALAAALFAPFTWRGRARLAALGAGDWLRLAAVGLLGYALPLILGLYGQHLSSGTSASLLACLEPVSLVALSCAFLGEALTGLKAASLAAGLAGAALIAFQGPPGWRAAVGGRLAGDLLLAAQGVLWSLYSVLGKPVLARVEPMDFTAATTLIAFAVAAPWAAPGLSPSSWRAAGAGPWLALVYLAVAASFLGALIWNKVLSRVEASATANFIFLQPLVGVALGAGLLGDPLSRWTLAGGALIVAGMWAASRGDPASAAAEPGHLVASGR